MTSQDTTDDIELESQPKPHNDTQQEMSMPGNVNSLQQLENIQKEYININQVCTSYVHNILCISCALSQFLFTFDL